MKLMEQTPSGGQCRTLPDIACEPHAGPQGTLDWVGMSDIELPIRVADGKGQPIQVLARVQAYVNLIDPASKGIHMSRLYLQLNEVIGDAPLTTDKLRELLHGFIRSHQGISDQAFVQFRFDYHEKRPSLLSGNMGWKSYPVVLTGIMNGNELKVELELEVAYSSTCPCSAALSRQLIQEGFAQRFGSQGEISAEAVHAWLGTTEGVSATPHSQRSVAQIRVELDNHEHGLPITPLIDHVEDALKTPVQAAVKREDEQEFARLNAANLMFCEDAARRLQAALNGFPHAADFWVRVNHMESLHPHNAVSVVTKGVPGGYSSHPDYFWGA